MPVPLHVRQVVRPSLPCSCPSGRLTCAPNTRVSSTVAHGGARLHLPNAAVGEWWGQLSHDAHVRDGTSSTQKSTLPQVTIPRPRKAFCGNRSWLLQDHEPRHSSGNTGQDLITTALGDITSYSHQVFLTTLSSPVLPLFIVYTSCFLLFLLSLHHLIAYLSGTRASVCLGLSQGCFVMLLACVTEQRSSQA